MDVVLTFPEVLKESLKQKKRGQQKYSTTNNQKMMSKCYCSSQILSNRY